MLTRIERGQPRSAARRLTEFESRWTHDVGAKTPSLTSGAKSCMLTVQKKAKRPPQTVKTRTAVREEGEVARVRRRALAEDVVSSDSATTKRVS